MALPQLGPRGWGAAIVIAVLVLAIAGLTWAARRRAAKPVADDKMGFFQHVAELRRRFLWMLVALFAGVIVAFGTRVERWHDYWALKPALYDNMAAQLLRTVEHHLVPPQVRIVTLRPMDGFSADFAVALGLGIAFSLPVLLWQIGSFLAPAVGPKHRKALAKFLVPLLVLFAGGVAFGYLVVLPTAFTALYAYADVTGAENMLQVNEFVSFTVSFLLVCGLSFETPLAMAALSRIGLVSPGAYLKKWRHAAVAIVILSAWITPDPTLISQVLVAGPLMGLYLLGIAASTVAWRRHQRSAAA